MPQRSIAKSLSPLTIWGVAGLVVVLAAAALFVRRGGGGRGAAVDVARGGADDLAGLQDEVQRLRRDLALVRAQAAQTAANQAAPAGSPAAAAEPTKEPSREEKRAEARAALQVWYGRIDAQLAAEAVDPAWSAEATVQFQNVMAKHSDHAQSPATRCGQSMCRIVVSHPDKDSQRAFASEIAEEAMLETEVAYKYDVDADPPTTTMWVARPGHKLPRAQKN